MWYVYILETQKGHFYTGATNDVPRRLQAHRAGKGAKYTRIFGVKSLVYQEVCSSKIAALRREAFIKSCTRQEKIQLISDNNSKPHQ